MAAIKERRRSYSNVNELNQDVFGGESGVAGAMASTNVITSAPVLASGANTSLSFQNIWTGTPTGTFSYEGSNDVDPINNAVVGWSAVTPDVAAVNPAGAAGGTVAVFKVPYYRWYREKYTNASGAGTLTAIAEGKGA